MPEAEREQGARVCPVIGLVGGVGSGKSLVASMLSELGAEVADADRVAHEVLEDANVKATLVEWWGAGILDHEGRVNRRSIAERVFDDSAARQRLESLIHPQVKARTRERFAAARQKPDVTAFVVDAPLLIEAGMDAELCDAVIFVEADLAVRQSRVKARGGWSPEEHARRERAQESLDLKRKRADYVVSNNSTPGALREEVARVFSKIRRGCSASARP